MTSVNGTLNICDDTNLPSLNFLCTGPSCAAPGFNFTCTQQSSSWNCNNGVTCSGTSRWSSSFAMNQPNLTFTSTQVITSNGSTYVLTQDLGGNVTVTNQTTTSSSLPGAATTITSRPNAAAGALQPPTFWRAILLLVLSVAIFASGAAAQLCLSDLQAIGKLSRDFLESLKTRSWNLIQEDMCALAEGKAIGQSRPSEHLEQNLMSLCVSSLLVAEVKIAVAAGRTASGEVTLPLTDAFLSGVLGRGAAAALLGPESALAGLAAAAASFLLLGLLDEAACPYIVQCFLDSFFDNTAEAICTSSAVGPIMTTTPAALPSSMAMTTVESPPTGTLSFGRPTITGSLLPIPSINLGSTAAKCQLCQLNSAFSFVQIDDQSCHNGSYMSIKSVLSYFYDPTVAEDPDFSQLCTLSCQNPCDQFSVNDWVSQLGTFSAGPFPNDYNCAQYCTDNFPKGNDSCLGPYGFEGTWCVGVCPGPESCPDCIL